MLKPALLGLSVVVAQGCKDEGGETPIPAAIPHQDEVDWSPRLREGTLDDILAALGQPHQAVRSSVGPHELHYDASISLTPATERDGSPPIDTKVVDAQAVHDQLTLRWAGGEGGPTFSLAQENDHERGRDVVVAQGQLYARLRHRGWTVHPLETNVFELWLDDAQHAVFDAVEFAAPRLSVATQVRDGEGLAGAEAVAVTFSTANAVDETRRPTGAVGRWRGEASLEEIGGNVLLDAKSGAWLQASVTVRYSLRGADGRQLRGSIEVTGSVTPKAAGEVEIVPPADAAPLPERTRYELERQRLLDGLAAP